MKYMNIKRQVSLYIILFSLLSITTYTLKGQVIQKEQLKPADYPLFGELETDKNTSNGDWVSFYMSYMNGMDTLFVKNTNNAKMYSFPLATNTAFVGNQHFAYTTKAGLHILNLENGRQQIIHSVAKYSSTAVANLLVVLTEGEDAKKDLLIIDYYGKTKKRINGVDNFIMSPCGEKLVYISKSEGLYALGLLKFEKEYPSKWIVEKSPNEFKSLTWEKGGRSLAFMNKMMVSSNRSSLFYYRADLNSLCILNPEKQSDFPKDKTIDNPGFSYRISISEDLNRVFFALGPNLTTTNLNSSINIKSNVEVWNSNDKWIYPMEQAQGQFEARPKLAVWFPLSGYFSQITSAELPKVMLTGNSQFAILHNPKTYEPQFEYKPLSDFYIKNLTTGECEIFLEKHESKSYGFAPLPSPGGKYIAYFKQNDWWVYNIYAKKHINLTEMSNGKFFGKRHDTQYHEVLYGSAGWTSNDEEMIVYDRYDIWLLKPDGSQARKITNGAEKKIGFRISKSNDLLPLDLNYDGSIARTLTMEDGLVIEATGDDRKSGFFKWDAINGERPIVYKEALINKLKVLNTGKKFLYMEQRFDQPFSLKLKNEKTTSNFFQSNPQQSNYQWGIAKCISYKNSRGEKLNGILYYPAGYDATKKYPMIVRIYERQSQDLYKYFNPKLELGEAYNPTVWTTQGYFVLCPDILKKDGIEGSTAVDCVTSATKEIISWGVVDSNRIGLMGYSFGGYGTTYIIGHSNIFAAAFAGAAVTNLASFYYAINWQNGYPKMNDFSSAQIRMYQPPFESQNMYSTNSPISSVPKITTPLLSSAGKNDFHVPWQQSVEFYLEMRRLSKKHIMLLYPQENHAMLNPVNMRDLTEKVIQWFAYYLKDEKPADWITKGTAPVLTN